jgi:hypothetical protein
VDNPPVEHKLASLGVCHGLGEQIMHFQDFYAPFLHFQHEIVVVLLGLMDPDDIVEQEIMAIAGGQPLMCKRWPAYHHRP